MHGKTTIKKIRGFCLRWLEGYAEEDFHAEYSLMAQTPTLTPAATRCDDFYRLFKGRDMGDLSRGLIHLHDNAIPKKPDFEHKGCWDHFSGDFCPIHPIFLTIPRQTMICWIPAATSGRSPIP
jgi:hypothetical protein